MLLSNRISKALQESVEAATQITNKNFDIDLTANGEDETAQLQSALNSMAATLRNNLAEITAKTE
ncbi:HAMP domain-containing protein [Maridesulfovibrio sp.]|uniref:HAMP domain-containing protein n=1 Tax=Maridesulfovibrio sp. TaxID=2795000 RepID=UPI0039EE0E6B